ncbi:hypothetical protein AVEN_135204-1 [Araneus ventricosus]|uniref:FIP-RBD domain-containing protein n=1 Tax=Araneus ventricosus TaxID=182803 RepID=A0A4Y2QTT7_ARAVE|nr:hypothetical protein AVEN_135204-1 [Araneus ventricosus]
MANVGMRKAFSIGAEKHGVNAFSQNEIEHFECCGDDVITSGESSTMSLPQSAMITSSIQEAESVEELPQMQEETEDMSDSSNSVESSSYTIPKPPVRKNHFTAPETKLLNHGEWTNRILSHSKESPIARSETNLIEALRSESPVRKGRFDTLRHNLRRHTLQLSESPDLAVLSLSNHQKRSVLKPESPKNNSSIPEGFPPEVIQQYEKMNHKDLVLLAIKQQADLERQRDKITDLENYLDNLLVRVMETTPRILQNPYKNGNRVCQR